MVYQPGVVTLPEGDDIDPFDLAVSESMKPDAPVKASAPAPMRELTPSELAAERAAKRKEKKAAEKPEISDPFAPTRKAVVPGSFDDLF